VTEPHALRWGLLSTARINRAVIPPLRASSRNRLVAVASRTMDRAVAYAREWGIERAYGSYEAMLADPEIDVVYLPLPNGLHTMWAIRAVEAGKHVLCEKPIALSVADLDAIADAAVRHRRIVAEAFMYRHHPQTALVQRLVRDGAIGDLRLIRGSFTFSLEKPDDVRWDPAQGGGSLWDIGCYPVSFARSIVGDAPADVRATQTRAPSGVDAAFAGVMSFRSGVLATIDCGFVAPFQTSMELLGTTGIIRVPVPFKPGVGNVVVVTDAAGATREIPAGDQELYSGEIEDLASAVLDGTPPAVSLADSRANTATLVALYESARLGQAVPVRV
jgi:D-xylose 1-dehydrogenase (NADP+, D-xylono-1,5-lactone-forming)